MSDNINNKTVGLGGKFISICILGEPIAKKSVRVSERRAFNPQTLVMRSISLIIQNQYNGPEIDQPISLILKYFMTIPKMSIKKQQEWKGNPHIITPDIDNLTKFYLDCCRFMFNDKLIYDVHASKVYDTIPRTEMIINLI